MSQEFDQSLQSAIESKKPKFIESAKQSILTRLRPIIEYKIREKIAPHTITEEQELNQYYVAGSLEAHQKSGKTHPYKSFSEFATEQRGGAQ